MRWVKGNLNIINLRTLQMVVRSGSHSAAAKKLGYTTSAVSQQIAALEKALGVDLFERGPRSLRPTAAGLAMSEHADIILRQVAEAEDEMRGYASGARGSLRIGASGTAAAQLVPRALSRLAMHFAAADISVEDNGVEQVASSVLEGTIDLGVVYEYEKVPVQRAEGLAFNTLLDEELVIIRGAHSQEPTTDRVSLGDFSHEVWVTNEVGSPGTDNFVQICRNSGFEPEVRFHSNDFDVVRGLVKETLGVALVPALALGIDRDIFMYRVAPPTPRRRVHVVHRISDTNPLLPATLVALRGAARDFLDWTTEAFGTRVEIPLGSTPND